MAIYVQQLTNEEKLTLKEMHKKYPLHLPRIRAHAILLSNQGYSVPLICGIYGVCRQTVGTWFSQWEKYGLCGLCDRPGRGRPCKLGLNQRDDIIEKIKKSPRSLKKIRVDIEKEMGVSISVETLKRICKKAKLVWKRIRKSLRSKRDQDAFDVAYGEIALLIQ